MDHNFYLTFITDAYSHKIVGYQIAETLESIECVKALEMALKSLRGKVYKLLHHSDRGVQYCSSDYVKKLQDHEIQISMTENGDPLENAVAERINGIIKEEYLFTYDIKSLNQAPIMLKRAIELYNNERPHLSISNLTPEYVHTSKLSLNIERLWKNYYKKNTILVKPFQD